MSYTPEQLEERYNQLPDAVKDAIYSVETSDKIVSIGKKHNLHIDQIGTLAEETGLVILGLTPYYQFEERLKGKLNVDRQTLESITTDINEEVFLPIRELLKQNPAPPKTTDSTFFEQKMKTMFNLPRNETLKQELPPKITDPYLENPE